MSLITFPFLQLTLRILHIIHITKICVNELFMLLACLTFNSRLLKVKLWGVKSYMRTFNCAWGVGSPDPHIAQGTMALCVCVCVRARMRA